MALSTYLELKESIQRWLWNRTDLVAVIPEFVRLCEAQMERALHVRETDKLVSLTTFEGEADLPCDFAEVRSLVEATDQRNEIQAVPLSVLENRRDVSNPQVAEYAIAGKKLLVWPRRDTELTLRYRARFPHLELDDDVNWLLEKHPDAYLYGSLMQAAPYLQEDERVGTWGGLYRTAIDEINRDGVRARIGAQAVMQPNGVVV